VPLDIVCNVKKSHAITSYRTATIRDTVVKYFKTGQRIPILDIIEGHPNCVLDYLEVRRILADDLLTETNSLYQYRVEIMMNYTRQTTEA